MAKGTFGKRNRTLACYNNLPIKTNASNLLALRERLGDVSLPPEESGGYVYFIWEHNQHDLVKIGWTSNYAQTCSVNDGILAIDRRGSLNSALPRTLLAFIPGNMAMETKLHDKFKISRFVAGVETEWFYPSEELLNFISNTGFFYSRKDLLRLIDSVLSRKKGEQWIY